MKFFLRGNGCKDERWWGFTSMSRTLLNVPELVAIMEETGVTEATLFRRIQQRYRVTYKKELKKITIIDKPKLSKAVMKESRSGARKS
jgi:hypothetical protein